MQLKSHSCSGEGLCAAEIPQLFRRKAVCSWSPTAVQERGCVQLKSHSCSWSYLYLVEILMYITSISPSARCTQPQASSVHFTPSHSVSSGLEFGM